MPVWKFHSQTVQSTPTSFMIFIFLISGRVTNTGTANTSCIKSPAARNHAFSTIL
jgi:hypothetical protein